MHRGSQPILQLCGTVLACHATMCFKHIAGRNTVAQRAGVPGASKFGLGGCVVHRYEDECKLIAAVVTIPSATQVNRHIISKSADMGCKLFLYIYVPARYQ